MNEMFELVEGAPLIILYATLLIGIGTAILSVLNYVSTRRLNKLSNYREVKESLLSFPGLMYSEDSVGTTPSSLLLHLRLIFDEIKEVTYKKHKKKLNLIASNYFFCLQAIKKVEGEQIKFNAVMQAIINSDDLVLNLFGDEPVYGIFLGLSFDEENKFMVKGKFNNFVFSKCELNKVDFSEATFEDIRFNESTLVGVDFSNTKIAKIDLEGSSLENVSFHQNQLDFVSEQDFTITKHSWKPLLYKVCSKDEPKPEEGSALGSHKINQKIYAQTKYLFSNVNQCKNMLRKDVDNPNIKRICIKESMNYSEVNNRKTNKDEYTSWYSISDELINDETVFYFIIKCKEKADHALVFRFAGDAIRTELIGDILPDANGSYNVYISRRSTDSSFVNNRVKQTPVYISKTKMIYGEIND